MSTTIPQPLVAAAAYPPPASARPSSSSSHFSKGNFGPVFAVLAVIIVVAVIACVIGRLCARCRGGRTRTKPPPAGRAQVKDGEDLEQGGFQLRMPMGKPARHAGSKHKHVGNESPGGVAAASNSKYQDFRGEERMDLNHHPGPVFGGKPTN